MWIIFSLFCIFVLWFFLFLFLAHIIFSLSQGWMDYVDQCILAWSSCWLLPLFSHHSSVHCGWNRYGGVCQGTFGPRWSESLWLGPLVPQNAGLWLHVHGLRPAEGQWHPKLLELHLLHHPDNCTSLHRDWQSNRWREGGKEREWGGEGGKERWNIQRQERVKSLCLVQVLGLYTKKKKPTYPFMHCFVPAHNSHSSVAGDFQWLFMCRDAVLCYQSILY